MEKKLTEDIILRKVLYGDASGLAKYGNNERIAVNQRDSYPYPYTIEYARNWIHYIKQHHDDTRFVIATENEAIGEIGFITQPDVHLYSGEVAYWIGEQYWGQGIATKALKYLINYAFKEKGMKRLYADILEYNKASCRVLQKCGFQLDGVMRSHIFKKNRFYDQLVFSLLSDDVASSIH
ncbi:MAG: GNAT family protein [Endozoicomonadaceae bacterium]|nr:GNAT family protein [Endozoicomonadaceae bacterium]